MAKTPVPLLLGFNRRFDPSAEALKRAVEAGEIGTVRQVIVSSRDPAPPPLEMLPSTGGLFRDMTIHDFDMGRWLLGEEPVEVWATASCLVNPEIAATYSDYDTAMVWAGEAVDLIKSVEGAAVLVERISAQAEAQLRAGAALTR